MEKLCRKGLHTYDTVYKLCPGCVKIRREASGYAEYQKEYQKDYQKEYRKNSKTRRRYNKIAKSKNQYNTIKKLQIIELPPVELVEMNTLDYTYEEVRHRRIEIATEIGQQYRDNSLNF